MDGKYIKMKLIKNTDVLTYLFAIFGDAVLDSKTGKTYLAKEKQCVCDYDREGKGE